MRTHPWALIVIFAAAFGVANSSICGEPAQRAYPLWDGVESVADYAKRVNLPPTKTLDLGNGVKLDLVLIPAGKFIMGTPEPTPVDEAAFRKSIVTGQLLHVVSAIALLTMLATVVVRAVRQKRLPQVSLALLLLMTLVAGVFVISGLHWWHTTIALETAKERFNIEKTMNNAMYHKEQPSHEVTLTKSFYMGKFTVTQEQYQTVTGTNPSHFKTNKDNPVEKVSWDDAQVFCQKLTEQTKHTVRLPTEAEWEYSCRAGTQTTYYTGDTKNDLDRAAWHDSNCAITTHPVGQKEPNAFALYDMLGNVWQWCQDWYAEDYYGKSEAVNPQGPAQGDLRLLRGGSWFADSEFCRSACRLKNVQTVRDERFGFRIVVLP